MSELDSPSKLIQETEGKPSAQESGALRSKTTRKV